MKRSIPSIRPVWKQLVLEGLRDDSWPWDWTALGTPSKKKIRARVISKASGVWAGSDLTLALPSVASELGDEKIQVKSLKSDGDPVRKGDPVALIEGPAAIVLGIERPYLNLAAYVSGIATQTHAMVSKSKGRVRIVSTRKILPGYRDVALFGVLAGGGDSHRTSLAGGVLIKENHIAAAGGIPQAIQGARTIAPHGLKIEIEVRDLKELELAVQSGAEVVLLDNFTPAQVKKAVQWLEKNAGGAKPVVEVSGGVTPENVASYVMPGVDVISSGSLSHSVRALDLSLLVQ